MEGFVALTVEGYPGYNLSAASALVQQTGGLRFTLFECNTTIAIRAGKHSNNVASTPTMWEVAGMQVMLNPLTNGALIAADHAHTHAALLIKFPAASRPDQLLYRLFYSGSPISQGRTVDVGQADSAVRASFATKTHTALHQRINQSTLHE